MRKTKKKLRQSNLKAWEQLEIWNKLQKESSECSEWYFRYVFDRIPLASSETVTFTEAGFLLDIVKNG